MSSWYFLRVAGRRGAQQVEERAAEILRDRLGVETILPRRAVWRWKSRVHRGRKNAPRVLRRYPIMPGYLLALLPDPPNWLEVMETPLVVGALGFDGQPRAISAAAVARTVQMDELAADERERWQDTGHEFREGDAVTVRWGALEGVSGPVVAVHGGREVEVMIELFGSSRAVRVAAYALTPSA